MGRSRKRLYLSNLKIFEDDRMDNKKLRAAKVERRGKCLFSRVQIRFEQTGEQRSSFHGRNVDMFVAVEDKIEPALSPSGTPRKKRPTSPKGASSPET